MLDLALLLAAVLIVSLILGWNDVFSKYFRKKKSNRN